MIHILIQDPNHSDKGEAVRAGKRVKMLRNMLKLLDQNFNNRYGYPVVFFVSPGFSKKSEEQVRSLTQSRARAAT